jgi:hypothetical protein
MNGRVLRKLNFWPKSMIMLRGLINTDFGFSPLAGLMAILFFPVNGCLLSTENSKNRINEAAPLDKRSVGYARRSLAQTKATTVVLELLSVAKKSFIPATHVLFDTWFCSPSSLIAIKEIGYDVIAMAKKTSKMHYLYKGKMQPLTEIYKQNRKRRGRSRYLLSVEVSLVKDGESIPARIVYVRNKNKLHDAGDGKHK